MREVNLMAEQKERKNDSMRWDENKEEKRVRPMGARTHPFIHLVASVIYSATREEERLHFGCLTGRFLGIGNGVGRLCMIVESESGRLLWIEHVFEDFILLLVEFSGRDEHWWTNTLVWGRVSERY